MSTLRDDEILAQGRTNVDETQAAADTDADDADDADTTDDADTSDSADTTDDADTVDPDVGPADSSR